MKRLIGLALLALSGIGMVHAEENCQNEERYLALANDAKANFKTAEAVAYLRNAVVECPRYATYQELGTLLSKSTERSDWQLAVDAFVSAYYLASTNTERAKTLFDYASLLSRDGDPSKAMPVAQEALSLAPNNSEIVELNERIEAQLQDSEAQIQRGWVKTLWVPLTFTSPDPESGGSSRPKVIPPPPPVGPSINIPINFYTGSTQVDSTTERNISELVSKMSSAENDGRSFVLIGHADERGGERENMALSRRRAEAIYAEVTRINPSMRKRISVDGRGEYEPIDGRHNEEAYRINRRLEVVLK